MKEANLTNLVMGLQDGDQLAFKKIYSQTLKKLYVYARLIMKDEKDAGALLEENYVAVVHSLENLDTPERFMAWTKKNLLHLAMQKCKSNQFSDEKHEDTGKLFEETTELSLAEVPDSIVEMKPIILKIVGELPLMQQISLLAYYYDEISITEIAEMMECTEQMVLTRLYDARQSIKEKLEEHESKDLISLSSLAPLLRYVMKEYDEIYAVPAYIEEISATEIINSAKPVEEKNLNGIIRKILPQGGSGFLGTAAVVKIMAAVLVIIMIAAGFGIASGINSPEKTLAKLEKNFNKRNLNGVFDCLDPQTKIMYTGIAGLASGVIDMDTEEVLSSLFGLTVGEEYEDQLKIDILIEDVKKEKGKAVASVCILSYEGKQLYDTSFEEVSLKKINGKWYVAE